MFRHFEKVERPALLERERRAAALAKVLKLAIELAISCIPHTSAYYTLQRTPRCFWPGPGWIYHDLSISHDENFTWDGCPIDPEFGHASVISRMVPGVLLTAVMIALAAASTEKGRPRGHAQALHPVLPWPGMEFLETYEVEIGALDVVEQNVEPPPLERAISCCNPKKMEWCCILCFGLSAHVCTCMLHDFENQGMLHW